MLVPISWLKKYVAIPKKLDHLTDALTYAGHMLDKTTKVGDDTVIDLELRGNREDLLGILGIAREVHALFDKPIKIPEEPDWQKLPQSKNQSSKIKIQTNAKSLVNRFYSVEITNLEIKPSPKWLQEALKKVKINPVNNVVDATNYIMYLTAQPLHAFDIDKIANNQLILRNGKKGDTFTTFEGHQIKVNTQDLIAADNKKCLGFLGVIGEKTSGVSNSTKTILLEGGNYNQVSVRHTRMRHKLPTEAALRLEKNIDPTLPPYAVKLCAQMITELADGQIVPNSWQDYKKQDYKNPWRTITFNPAEVARLSGIEIPIDKIEKIFKLLGLILHRPSEATFKFKNKSRARGDGDKTSTNLDLHKVDQEKQTWQIDIPWRRSDIEGPADLVEEILRIYGYQEIPAQPITDPVPRPIEPPRIKIQDTIRDILAHLDFKENLTNSFISEVDQKAFHGSNPKITPIPISNPTSPETALLRTSLLPAQIQTAQNQLHTQVNHIALFEIGNTYHAIPLFSKGNYSAIPPLSKGGLGGVYKETLHLSGIYLNNHQSPAQNYQTLLTKLQKLLKHLQFFDFQIQSGAKNTLMDPNQSALINQGKLKLIKIGFINPKLAARLNLSTNLLLFDCKIENLVNAKRYLPTVTASTHPPIIEDMTFELPGQTHIGPVINIIKSQSKLIKKVELTDTYKNSHTFNIIYQSDTRNLSSDDIHPLRAKITQALKTIFHAKLKGKL